MLRHPIAGHALGLGDLVGGHLANRMNGSLKATIHATLAETTADWRPGNGAGQSGISRPI